MINTTSVYFHIRPFTLHYSLLKIMRVKPSETHNTIQDVCVKAEKEVVDRSGVVVVDTYGVVVVDTSEGKKSSMVEFHPTGICWSLICWSSHSSRGWKYSTSALALNFRLPVISTKTSGHGLELPAWSIWANFFPASATWSPFEKSHLNKGCDDELLGSYCFDKMHISKVRMDQELYRPRPGQAAPRCIWPP